MGKYKLVVMSDSIDAAHEEEYNAWYNDRHLRDVVAIPGFASAQRFELKTTVMGNFTNKYIAIYDMDCDDPQHALDTMMEVRGTETMPISEAFDLASCDCALFEAVSPEVAAL